MAQTYIVTGAEGGTFPRLELRDLVKNPHQWSLFTNAMSTIMQPAYAARGNPASWSQMGGIHGEPYERWTGDPNGTPTPINPDDPDQWQGYCHHGSILFPTWHRVVLLLLEQSVTREAATIAQRFSSQASTMEEREAWLAASRALRFPFWDWTLPETGRDGVPEILMQKDINVLGPNKTSIPLSNPLYTYKLNGLNKVFQNSSTEKVPSWLHDWTQTYRWPTDTRPHEDAQSDPAALNNAFINGATINSNQNGTIVERRLDPYSALIQQVRLLFTYPMAENVEKKYYGNLWNIFSNTSLRNQANTQPQDVRPYVGRTVEQPHNLTHMLVGGYGHMADNDTAGFDPIFYLHHANVDRLYALWEYIHPEYWMNQGWTDNQGATQDFRDSDGSWVMKHGSVVDGKTPLVPFRKDENSYWTSNDVQGLQPGQGLPKNYTYPPIEVLVSKEVIKVQVDQPCTYEDRVRYQKALKIHFLYALQIPQILKQIPPFKPRYLHSQIHSEPKDEVEEFERLRHFNIIATSKKSMFERSHFIELYLPAEVQTADRPAQPEVVVASVGTLKRSKSDRCANCVGQEEEGVLISGQMAMDPFVLAYLLERYGLNREDATKEEVIALVKGALKSRIMTSGRQAIVEGGAELRSDSVPQDADKIPDLTLIASPLPELRAIPDGGAAEWEDLGSLGHQWTKTGLA